MRKLAYILGIALFFFGCGTNNTILKVSYDPIDYPPQFFSLKDKQPVAEANRQEQTVAGLSNKETG